MDSDNNILYREWAPGALDAFLIGDFSAFIIPKTCNVLIANDWQTIGTEALIP